MRSTAYVREDGHRITRKGNLDTTTEKFQERFCAIYEHNMRALKEQRGNPPERYISTPTGHVLAANHKPRNSRRRRYRNQ